MAAVLVLMKDGRPVKRFALGERTALGRSDTIDIQIDEIGVSRQHATITRAGAGYTLEDRGSSNGTLVNGQQVRSHQLGDGDEIQIGTSILRFHPAGHVGPDHEGKVAVVQDLGDTTNVVTWVAASTGAIEKPSAESEDALRRRLQVFFDLAGEVTAAFELDELLPRVLEALFRVFTEAHRGFIMLLDPQTGELVPKAVKKTVVSDEEQITVSRTVVNQVLDEHQAVLCEDAASDDRFQGAESIMSHAVRSLMCAPLIAKDEIVGIVHIDTTSLKRPFTEDDLNVLTGIAAQAAMAIRNAQIYEEKVKAERLAVLGQTVAGLAHCIKNLLNGISGGAYILERGLEGRDLERVLKGWEMVKRNNEFMSELVLDMLAYAKEREPAYALTDINGVVGSVCELMTERARQHNVELACELGEVKPSAMDATEIRRCVLNLVTNAVDACAGHGTRVCARTYLDEGQREVCVVIADDGCGISEENQKRLFQVFFSTKGAKGTGLGLAVTHKIIHEHHGEIDVASEEGEGTTFTIRLPFAESVPPRRSPAKRVQPDTESLPAQREEAP